MLSLSQLSHLKSDPLDVLLFALGLRLTQLAKNGDDKFKSLLENRNFTIQLGSEAEGTARHYSVENGRFSQEAGPADNPTLTITFKDSMTGVKLLTKGEATAFMTGIQNGDLKMSGDYSLLMWFNQISKFIVPKVPEPLKPVVEQAKPLLEKATPFAKDLCSKAMALFGGAEATKAAGSSKYFNENNTKDVNDSSESKLDSIKAKANEIKKDVSEKVDELKAEAKEKLGTIKDEASEKLADVKDVAKDKVDVAKDKLDTAKEDTQEKLAEVKETADEKVDAAKTKLVETKSEVEDKATEVKEEAKDKLDSVKEKADEKLNEAKDKVESAKSDIKDELESDTKDINSTFDSSVLTPSQKMEAKHANDEIIADNVETDAVKNENSPITNITITRSEDKTSTDK